MQVVSPNSGGVANSIDHGLCHYDLVVIGAGVFGAMLSLEAAQRGLKVLLLDRADIGGFTSANSLKTIHGGLRYLQSVDLKSSLISSQERANWLRMMPGMIRPLKCMLPTSSSLMKSPFVVGAGMICYNILTFNRNKGLPPESCIPSAKLESLEVLQKSLPRMDVQGLKGAGVWHDAQAVNTERAVVSVCEAAKKLGAEVRNYCAVKGFKKNAKGFELLLDDSSVSARFVFDCTGANSYLCNNVVPEISTSYACSDEADSTYVKAVNLIVKRKLSDSAFGFKASLETGSERLLFAAPWKPHVCSAEYTIVGTWYFEHEGQPVQELSTEQMRLCLDELNTAFVDYKFDLGDVVQTHIGYLPVSKSKMKLKGPDSSLIKSTRLLDLGMDDDAMDGLFVLKGTKYTLARNGAEMAVNYLARKYQLELKPSISAQTPLWSIDPNWCGQLLEIGMSNLQCKFLLEHFAMVVPEIIEICTNNPSSIEGVPGSEYCCKAIFDYCIREEQVFTLVDLLVRRIPLGSAEMPSKKTIDFALAWLGNAGDWSSLRRDQELESLSRYYLKLAS